MHTSSINETIDVSLMSLCRSHGIMSEVLRVQLIKKIADFSCTSLYKKWVVSPVWNYFGLHVDNKDNVVVVCKWCNSNVLASNGNVSNILSKLITHHPS